MSLDATRWAWQQDLRPSHKLLLLSLADRAGEGHECYPSIARLQSDTGLYRETIMEAITHLERLGLLSVNRVNGRGSQYTLLGVGNRHEEDNQSAKPVGKTIPVVKSRPVGKTRPHQSGKADCHQSGKADSESTNESINEPTKVVEAKIPDPEGLDVETWKRWFDYRKQIKKPIVPASVNAAKKALAEFGSMQAAVVEQSIANTWQGLFQLKRGANQTVVDLSIFKD
jgi:hypothetical protein